MKYYLFLRTTEELSEYKQRFLTTKEAIEKGVTPVYNEVGNAKINLIETVPYNLLDGLLLILGTMVINKLNVNQLLGVAVVLVVNSLCGCLSNYIFVILKHQLRVRLCKKLNIQPTDKNIAVMESMEYQTVC